MLRHHDRGRRPARRHTRAATWVLAGSFLAALASTALTLTPVAQPAAASIQPSAPRTAITISLRSVLALLIAPRDSLDPPATDPSVTDPPSTDPPTTAPPDTTPPSTSPPATTPPTDPPGTSLPHHSPPTTRPASVSVSVTPVATPVVSHTSAPHEHVAHEHAPHSTGTHTVARTRIRALRPLGEPSLFAAVGSSPPTTGGPGAATAARHPSTVRTHPDQLGVGVVALSGVLVGLGLVAGVLSRHRRRPVPDALI